MGDVGDDEEWESEMSRNFRRMELTRDEETGECWAEEEVMPCNDSSASSSTAGKCNQTLVCRKSCWRVPKEYSRLGSSPSCDLMDTLGASGCDDMNNLEPTEHECQRDEGAGDKQALLVATFPSPGKVPLFCRKRRGSGPCIKEPAKKTGCMERFLEGREGLRPYVLVGRLFFAFLVLLSPGVLFPFLLFVRIFCHVQRHNSCFSQQEEEEASAALLAHRAFPFGFLRPAHIFRMSCRFCRENMKSEKMFRIHAQIGGRKPTPAADGIAMSSTPTSGPGMGSSSPQCACCNSCHG